MRQEIERLEGRRRFLSEQAQLSTIELTAREGPGETETLSAGIQGVWGASVDALSIFLQRVLLIVVSIVPWLPLIGVLALAWWRIRRRRASTPPSVA